MTTGRSLVTQFADILIEQSPLYKDSIKIPGISHEIAKNVVDFFNGYSISSNKDHPFRVQCIIQYLPQLGLSINSKECLFYQLPINLELLFYNNIIHSRKKF